MAAYIRNARSALFLLFMFLYLIVSAILAFEHPKGGIRLTLMASTLAFFVGGLILVIMIMVMLAGKDYQVKPGALTVGMVSFIGPPMLLVALATSGNTGGAISSLEQQSMLGSSTLRTTTTTDLIGLQWLCLFAMPVFLVIIPQWFAHEAEGRFGCTSMARGLLGRSDRRLYRPAAFQRRASGKSAPGRYHCCSFWRSNAAGTVLPDRRPGMLHERNRKGIWSNGVVGSVVQGPWAGDEKRQSSPFESA
jgi:hypothetical protein